MRRRLHVDGEVWLAQFLWHAAESFRSMAQDATTETKIWKFLVFHLKRDLVLAADRSEPNFLLQRRVHLMLHTNAEMLVKDHLVPVGHRDDLAELLAESPPHLLSLQHEGQLVDLCPQSDGVEVDLCRVALAVEVWQR